MDFKKLLPHLIAVLILFAVAAIFFAPNAFSGKALPQPDNDKARGMQTEIQAYIKNEGETPLWTNSAFGGMPSFQIYAPTHGNLTNPVLTALLLGSDISSTIWTQIFLAMLCMYLLLSVLKADWRVAAFGALAFGITTYNIDLLEAGHTTKMIALALAPGILAGLVLTFNRQLLLGGALLGLFMSLQICANHVQITYYTLLISGIYFLVKGIEAIREKSVGIWLKSLTISALALALGFAANTSKLWPTYEYSQETIRGKSELTQKSSKGDGLDKDYLFGWSYGVDESLTLLVPHYAGGGAGERFKDTKLYQAVSPQARNQISGLFYTGDQPFVGTAIYFGAVVFFLFVLGAFLAPGAPKYWLLTSGLFAISLAWGKYFFLNSILYDILPMFNKFRAVSMALGIAQLCVAALAALGLQKMCSAEIAAARKRKALWWAAGISAGLCLVAWATGSATGAHDNVLEQQPELLRLLQEDRSAMLRSDVMRSLFLIALATGALWLYLKGSLKAGLVVIALGIVSLADNWIVCARTIDAQKYTDKRSALAPPQEESFDKQIKQDPDPHYRVLDLARGSITGNAISSYFHKSLSGYHAAKLQRYQEVVDSFLIPDLNKNLHIVGMLNGKYIVTQNGAVVPNPKACGHAWFVRHFDVVQTADQELNALHRINPKDTAVIQQSFAASLNGLALQADTTASIRLTHYHPAKMEYEYSARTEQLAVFPEIYYPPSKGWKCYINGQAAPDFIKADYLLRAMRLPSGANMKLEMRFEPQSYFLGEKISLAASLAILLAVFGGLFFFFRKNKNLPETEILADVPSETRSAAAKPAAHKPKGIHKPGKK